MLTIEHNAKGAVMVDEDGTTTHFAASLVVDMWPVQGIIQLSCAGRYLPEKILSVGEKASYTIAGDYRITVERVAQSEKVIKLRRRG